jgi:uncharacterized membrane protein YebE (DUF533 family)
MSAQFPLSLGAPFFANLGRIDQQTFDITRTNMNLQNLLSEFSAATQSQNAHATSHTPQSAAANSPVSSNPVNSALQSIKSSFPGGLAGGAAAGGVVALLLGSKSTRKVAKKMAKFGGTAVLGGLAYKAYSNWQDNKALNQTQPLQDQDIQQAAALLSPSTAAEFGAAAETVELAHTALEITLVKAMIAASKADGQIDAVEQKRLLATVEKLNLDSEQKGQLFGLMAADISVQEIAASVETEEARAEVYLAAYLAIEVDDQRERAFLNDLSLALKLPRGLAAYLEQQADQGVSR